MSGLRVLVWKLCRDIIYVPDQLPTIEDAINAASDGHIIVVRDGEYVGNIVVNKSLTIMSENGSDLCILKANNSNPVIKIASDYVKVQGFKIVGGSPGIELSGVKHCEISSNIVEIRYKIKWIKV